MIDCGSCELIVNNGAGGVGGAAPRLCTAIDLGYKAPPPTRLPLRYATLTVYCLYTLYNRCSFEVMFMARRLQLRPLPALLRTYAQGRH